MLIRIYVRSEGFPKLSFQNKWDSHYKMIIKIPYFSFN
jgi:hypothetical protein